MSIKLTPSCRLLWEGEAAGASPEHKKIISAFEKATAAGLLAIAGKCSAELRTIPTVSYWRDFANKFLTALCHSSENVDCIPHISWNELEEFVQSAPPMTGIEYLSAELLQRFWQELYSFSKEEIAKVGLRKWIKTKNPLLHLVGRVTFHLAENKRNKDFPFAFLATYSKRLTAGDKLQYLPLGKALEEYSDNKPALVSLLSPVRAAAQKSDLIKSLVDSGGIYHPQAWTPDVAHRFLKETSLFEDAGVIIRLPNWWKKRSPPRPVVNIKIGDSIRKNKLGANAMLDFSIELTLDGEKISPDDLKNINTEMGLALFRGKWIEIDKKKINAALEQWEKLFDKFGNQISFAEGMRLLAGFNSATASNQDYIQEDETQRWTVVTSGKWLTDTLKKLRAPDNIKKLFNLKDLKTNLRHYQLAGLKWLYFMYQLGLGSCLADDMGLGKTVQIIALLLALKKEKKKKAALLIVPASLIANWRSEIEKFAPSLSFFILHPSQNPNEKITVELEKISKKNKCSELFITTYSMAKRLKPIAEIEWDLIILDEAQAIKNPNSQQTRAIKKIKADKRIILTGTPVENKLLDLWSLFDFINPGLLGTAKYFSDLTKRLAAREHNQFAPVRKIVQPYILRRLKTDKSIISDLPDKTEVNAYCTLTKKQALLYQNSVDELKSILSDENIDGIKRRGLVLAFLTRLKQICNHPSQWLGDNNYLPEHSGKFARLAEICEEIAARQEKALIFTQYREMTAPLNDFLKNIFGREGVILHGGTSVKKRKSIVDAFQNETGPPFFILSLKAGGTGLNLTAASHVIHFDRWWNPAVENQATDRAFRIGQKKNVLVHKFVCQATVEEKIDAIINEKSNMADQILKAGPAKILTEMSDAELINFIKLDL